jgi:site-specific DNA-methyltransferase (adenine-specific)
LTNIDAVVTDPPYGMKLNTDFSGMKNNSNFKNGKSNGAWVPTGNTYEPVIGDDKEFDPTIFLLGKQQVFFGCDYFYDKLPKGGSVSIWDKRLSESSDKAFGSCYETIWFSKKRKKDFIRHKWFGCFGTEKEDIKKRIHPTQKPIGVMEWCISKLDKNVETILDPFMGVGSCGIAAINLGKKFIGIEIDKKYFDLSVDRIKKAHYNNISKLF